MINHFLIHQKQFNIYNQLPELMALEEIFMLAIPSSALKEELDLKQQLQWKDTLAQFYGNWMHEGQILDPVMRDIEAFLANSQQNVTGDVFVQLMPYRFQVIGIESKYDLMSSKFGKYGEMNTGFTGDDVRGFSKIFGNQTSIWNAVQKENEK